MNQIDFKENTKSKSHKNTDNLNFTKFKPLLFSASILRRKRKQTGFKKLKIILNKGFAASLYKDPHKVVIETTKCLRIQFRSQICVWTRKVLGLISNPQGGKMEQPMQGPRDIHTYMVKKHTERRPMPSLAREY